MDSVRLCYYVAIRRGANRPFIQLFDQNAEPNHRQMNESVGESVGEGLPLFQEQD